MKGYTLLGVLMLLVSTVDSQYIFTLPPKSGFQSGMCYIEDGTYYRLFANRVKKETYIEAYNLQTGKLRDSHTITGLSDAQAFYKVSDNEFWLFDVSKAAFVFAKDGKIVKRIPSFGNNEPESGYYHYFIDMAHNPIHYYRSKIYAVNALYRVAGVEIKHTKSNEFIYETDEKSLIHTKVPIPATLFSKDFGMLNRFTSLRRDNVIVIAPIYSNEIMLYNMDNGNVVFPVIDKNNSYYSVTKPLFEGDKFDTDQLTQKLLDNRMNEHYESADMYVSIHYDPYRKVYYRALRRRKPENKNETNLTIVVLDERFRFLKSQELDKKYLHYGMFVSEKGLNIFNHQEYMKNNNSLTFDTFLLW